MMSKDHACRRWTGGGCNLISCSFKSTSMILFLIISFVIKSYNGNKKPALSLSLSFLGSNA